MAKAWKKTERPIYGDARTELTAPVREIVILDDPEEVKSTVSPEPADGTTVDKRNGGVVSEITTYDTPNDNVGGATGEKPNETSNDKSEETPKWTPIDEGLVDPVPGSPEDKSKQQDKKGGETTGTTVPQNNQSNTKSGGGTSVSNDNGVIKVGEQNANLNYYQYGDDSNPAQQGQKGGMNPKYTGEGVSNSYIEYNPDLTVADLDPNYLYGENARQQNRQEAGYIARRNDNIASALYNEGLTSREDVANFLSQQKEWMNSTEADRENTIESIYKRLGQMKPQEEKPDLSKADNLVTDTSNTLYGKTTAEEGNPRSGIETKVDANSVLNAMEQRRSSDLKNFVSRDIQSIASCVVAGMTDWDEQTWRDAQEIYPDFIAAVNAEVKKQRGQQNVTAIASGGEMATNTEGQSNINNSIASFGASNATSTKNSVEITKDVHDSLAKNQTANEASATMEGIEEDMAILKNRLKNLRQEANAAFKGDVPDYLVNAYINNKTQEIQNQMSILEDRYNAAYNRYKLEVANTQWEKEFGLKQKQLELEEKELNLKEWQVKNGITTTSSNTSDTATTNEGDKWEVTTLSDGEVSSKVDTLVDMFEKGQLGNAQCGVGIQTYYLPMLGISLNGISTMEQKKSLINEGEGYMPKKGDLIILKGSKSEYGHIGIVVGVSEDGSIQYLDWNGTLGEDGNGDGTPQMRWLKSNSEKIIGYRNVNKKGEQASNREWTDYDYTRFNQYKDATSESVKKTIADEYRVDVATMSDIVRDALYGEGAEENVGEDKELGYDEELGYNPYDKEIYDDIISNKATLEDGAKKTGLSEQEIRRRVLNYQDARAKGVDAYDDGSRNIDSKYGFNLDKKMVYQGIANKKGNIPGTQKETILRELGFNPKDPNAWDKALDETAKRQEWQKQELDSQALDSLRAVEYIIMQDATRGQRLLAVNGGNQNTWYGAMDVFGGLDRLLSGEAASWENSYKYIRDKLTLDYLVDLKNRGATFGALSNQELEAIGNAASLVMYTDESERFRYNVNNLYNELRKALGYEVLSENELNAMWNAEDDLNFDNYITLTKDPKSKKGKQNIVPQRSIGEDLGNRWETPEQGSGEDILNEILS